jgi:hypothetical protein
LHEQEENGKRIGLDIKKKIKDKSKMVNVSVNFKLI